MFGTRWPYDMYIYLVQSTTDDLFSTQRACEAARFVALQTPLGKCRAKHSRQCQPTLTFVLGNVNGIEHYHKEEASKATPGSKVLRVSVAISSSPFDCLQVDDAREDSIEPREHRPQGRPHRGATESPPFPLMILSQLPAQIRIRRRNIAPVLVPAAMPVVRFGLSPRGLIGRYTLSRGSSPTHTPIPCCANLATSRVERHYTI